VPVAECEVYFLDAGSSARYSSAAWIMGGPSPDYAGEA